MENNNIKNRFFENPIYEENNIVMKVNPLYYNTYNTLDRNRNNNHYSKLKTFNDDNIYQYIDITNNITNNITNKKYKLPDDWIELIDEDSGNITMLVLQQDILNGYILVFQLVQ